MAYTFSRTILANVDERRTEAEVSADGALVAVVYETEVGWHTEWFGPALDWREREVFSEEITSAREALQRYIHRLGSAPPAGLSREGLASWLMEKEEGSGQ